MKNTDDNRSNEVRPGVVAFCIVGVALICAVSFLITHLNTPDGSEQSQPSVQKTNDVETHDAPNGNTSYVGVEPSVAKQQTFVQPTDDTNKLAQIAVDQRIAAEKNLAAFMHATELNRTQAVTPGK